MFARTRRKGKVIEKYEEIGLMLFVAIPLPVTGAWTGSLAAYLFGLKFWKSILNTLRSSGRFQPARFREGLR